MSRMNATQTPPNNTIGSGAGSADAAGDRDSDAAGDGAADGASDTFGSGPLWTPLPLASLGRIRIQPGASTSGSVRRPPSGCVRPSLSLKISWKRSPLPRVLAAIS